MLGGGMESMPTPMASIESRRAGVDGRLNLALDFREMVGISGMRVATPGVTSKDLLLIGAYKDISEFARGMPVAALSIVGETREFFLAGSAT